MDSGADKGVTLALGTENPDFSEGNVINALTQISSVQEYCAGRCWGTVILATFYKV